jgi:drug/metabolite transporter (DMT)-like permease
MLSIGFALNAVLAWWLLGEAVTPVRMLGIGVIIVGVWLVARPKKTFSFRRLEQTCASAKKHEQ